jgi:nicotinate phosphoribosyltransferase
MTRRKTIPAGTRYEELLVPIMESGRVVYEPPGIGKVRERTAEQLGKLHPTIKRFVNPHTYPVGLEEKLFDLRTELILKARGARAS